MLLLAIAVLVLALTYHLLKTKKYRSLPSPGLALPLVGHVYKLFTAEAQKDPINFLWKLNKKHQLLYHCQKRRIQLIHMKGISENIMIQFMS